MKNLEFRFECLLIFFLFFSPFVTDSFGATKVVDRYGTTGCFLFWCFNDTCMGNVPYEQTIQPAINASSAGDEIVICPAVYNENITINKNNLTLRSSSGNASDVIIQSDNTSHTVTINNGKTTMQNLSVAKTNSTSASAIYSNTAIDNGLELENIALTSSGNGLFINQTINSGGLILRNATIQSTFEAVSLGSNVTGLFHVENSTISGRTGIIASGTINTGFVIENSNITATGMAESQNALYFRQAVNNRFEITNTTLNANRYGLYLRTFNTSALIDGLNIESSGEGGIYFENSLNRFEMRNSNINSEKKALYFNENVNGGVVIEDTTIEAQAGIHARVAVNNGFVMQGSEIVSFGTEAAQNGIYLQNTVNGGVVLDGLDINSKRYGVYTGAINTGMSILDSRITGEMGALHGLGTINGGVNISGAYFEGLGEDAVRLNSSNINSQNSCYIANGANKYALNITAYGSNSVFSQNCFYATDSSYLARAQSNGNNFASNYWDGVDGDYQLNNIMGTSPLLSCPNSCTLSETCQNFDDGYHIVDPFGSTEKKFEVYCKDKITYLPLPFFNSRAQNSNFLFTSNPVNNNYYHANNSSRKKAIKMLEVDFDIPSEQLIVNKIIYEDDTQGFDFSNLNLIGTPFAFLNPRDTASITNCSVDNTSRVRVGMNQAIKINPKASGYSRRCTISSPKLRFLNDYKFLEFDGAEYLYPDCAQIATNTTIAQIPEVTGSFYIDPKQLGRSHDDPDRAFVASCKYQGDLSQAWTFLLVLDGYTTTTKNDITGIQDTCSKLGLTFYTPNSKTTFGRMQQFLLDSQPSQWGNYVGTVKEYFTDNGIGGWATDSQTSELKPYPIPDGLMWPYGPMGIYRPSNGAGGNNDKKMPKSAQYLSVAEKNAGFGSMEETGWRSLYYDYYNDLEKDLWWVADIAAGYRADLSAQSPKPVEPNGDYDANNWLGWFTDADGNIVHFNDQNGNNRYRYSNYMCMSFSNIDEIARYQPVFGAFDVIERSVPSGAEASSRTIQTKVVAAPIELDMIVLREDESSLEPNKEVSVGLFLNEIEVVGGAETPKDVLYVGDIKRDNTGSLADHKPTGRIWLPSFSRLSAHPKLLFRFKYCNKTDYEWTDCWNVSGNIATCKPTELSTCESVDSDYFALRPKNFSIPTPANIFAGENFELHFQALGDNGNSALNYNETRDESFEVNALIAKSGCSDGNLSMANFSFHDGEQNVITNYSENGDVNITIKEKLGSEFASIDASDTPVAQRLIPELTQTITIKPYDLNITKADYIASTGADWLYMADLNEMNVTLHVSLEAFNKDGARVQNFDANCFANSVDIGADLSVSREDGTFSFTTSGFNDENGTSISVTDANFQRNLTFASLVFFGGMGEGNFTFSIDRNSTIPKDPLVITANETRINTPNIAKNQNDLTINESKTFVYGRIRPINTMGITNLAQTPVEIEVFNSGSSNFTDGMFAQSLYWYRNENHDSIVFGEIQSAVASQLDALLPALSDGIVATPGAINGGVQELALSATLPPPLERTIHLRISPWLWYSTQNTPYDASINSSCKAHPCFSYQYDNFTGREAIKSGDFRGLDFEVDDLDANSSAERKRGVKVFR